MKLGCKIVCKTSRRFRGWALGTTKTASQLFYRTFDA